MITDAKLKFWIDNNLNVLFIGSHGVGKTARVKEAFDSAGLKWLYFSAATLDPWVDFIGIPKEAQDERGNKYIELIRPKPFAEDSVEAIFVDEYNRSQKKVRNAVMELIQFRSINGKKFNNLRIIWAAINPDDVKTEDGDELEYNVERLDPAQKDRFEIQVDVPYKPDKAYFLKKFGENLCESAIDWWNGLSEKEKKSVSPRRLDYTLDVYTRGGDIRDVLPNNVNVSKLITELKNGSYVKLMKASYAQGDVEEAKKFMSVRNNYENTIRLILKSEDMIKFFIPCINEEDLVNLMGSEKKVYDHVVENYSKYENIIKNILDVNNNPKLSKRIKNEPKLLETISNLKNKAVSISYRNFSFSKPTLRVKPVVKNQFGIMFNSLGGQSFSNFINDTAGIESSLRKGTQYRVGVFQKILQNITDSESDSDYFTSLVILCNIISSTHKSSLKATMFRGMAELFGYLVRKYVDNNNMFNVMNKTPEGVIDQLRYKCNNKFGKVEEFLFNNSELYV